MNVQDLINRLVSLEKGDEEYNHIKADQLLLEYINNPEVTEAFNNIHKWYA